MSYILAALEKSDQQRQPRGTFQSPPAAPCPDKPAPTTQWRALALSFSLAAIIIGLQWPALTTWLTPASSAPTDITASAISTPPPGVINPTHHSRTTLEVQQAAIRKQMQAYRQSNLASLNSEPEQSVKNSPPVAPDITASTATEPALPPVDTDSPMAELATTPDALHDTQSVPLYIPRMVDLPLIQQQQIPDLKVSVIIYSTRSKNRRARINNAMYYEGDPLPQGLTLQEIRPTALILSHNGQRFQISP